MSRNTENPAKKAKSPKSTTPLVKIMDSGTLCIPGQVCLLSRYSLVLTCVACLEIEEQLYSFRARRRLRPRSCLSGKPLVFHRRYAFLVLQLRSQCLNPGNYQAFNLIQHTKQCHNSIKTLLLHHK